MNLKRITAVLVIAMFVGCQNQDAAPNLTNTESVSTFPQNEVENSGKITNFTTGTFPPPNITEIEPIIWVEENEEPEFDDDLRWIGIEYREIDLSEIYFRVGLYWDDESIPLRNLLDYSEVYGQRITTRDEAAYVANKVWKIEQREHSFEGFELNLIEFDPNENIWIFKYWERMMIGTDIAIAVNGENSEVLRSW
jgi:hypothetical protein